MTVPDASWLTPAAPVRPTHAHPPPRRADVAPLLTPTGRRVAGFGRRVVPLLVDRLLGLVLFAGAAWAWEGSGAVDAVPAGPLAGLVEVLLVLAVVLVGCGPWLLVDVVAPALTGTTPGKALVGLEIVTHRDGRRPSVWRLLGRWASAVGLGLVPFGTLVDHLLPLWQQRWATVHDLVAGTAVVHRVGASPRG